MPVIAENSSLNAVHSSKLRIFFLSSERIVSFHVSQAFEMLVWLFLVYHSEVQFWYSCVFVWDFGNIRAKLKFLCLPRMEVSRAILLSSISRFLHLINCSMPFYYILGLYICCHLPSFLLIFMFIL